MKEKDLIERIKHASSLLDLLADDMESGNISMRRKGTIDYLIEHLQETKEGMGNKYQN